MRPTCAIRVHDYNQARSALEAAEKYGIDLVLLADASAATFGGVGFLRALGDLVGREIVVDCGDRAGLAMAALRQGMKDIAFDGAARANAALGSIAGNAGANIRAGVPPADIDLDPGDDACRAIARWYETASG